MKKQMIAALVALVLALGCAPAMAQTAADTLILSATVEGLDEVALKAPASGELAPFSLRVGDTLAQGDAAFVVEPVQVYSDIDGVVADVYAAPGDMADAAVTRFGAVLFIEYAERYEIRANTRTGYNNAQNRDVRVGAAVYLRSANEKHFADGRITAIDGNNFTVQVIGGDLVFTQDVKIYREPDYDNKTLLARATLSSVQPYAVTAGGTVVQMAVKPGDAVSAGDLLFTYVPDALDPDRRGKPDATSVKAEQALIVTEVDVAQGASVQKGQVLARGIPEGSYRLRAQVEEGDAQRVQPGDVLTVRFEEIDLRAQATVQSVSPLGDGSDVSRYDVWLAFDAPKGVLPGMHATVEKE